MKFRNYIVTFQLRCGAQINQAPLSRKLFAALCSHLNRAAPRSPLGQPPSGVKYAYFAVYAQAGASTAEVRISLALHARKNSGLHVVHQAAQQVYREVALRSSNVVASSWVKENVKVERRGELSPLHSAIMAVALLPEARDPQQLADAFHWCLNAAGYHYLDEAIIAAGMAYNASRGAHPSPNTAPLPYGFRASPPP